MTNEMKTT